MGAMKRLHGYRVQRWHIPRPLRVLAGLEPRTDPDLTPTHESESESESAREARAERQAIQWEASLNETVARAAAESAEPPPGVPRLDPPPLEVRPCGPPRPGQGEPGRPAPAGPVVRDRVAPRLEDSPGPPVAAARGFYRVGSSFYHVGQGPHPDFGKAAPETTTTVTVPSPARQLTLF